MTPDELLALLEQFKLEYPDADETFFDDWLEYRQFALVSIGEIPCQKQPLFTNL